MDRAIGLSFLLLGSLRSFRLVVPRPLLGLGRLGLLLLGWAVYLSLLCLLLLLVCLLFGLLLLRSLLGLLGLLGHEVITHASF